MAFSGISSSQLNSVLETLLESEKKANSTTGTNSTATEASAASGASAASTTSLTSAASTTSTDSATATTNTTLTQELAALLKALATGDLAGAKQDLTALKADLAKNSSASTAAAASTANASSTGATSPLDKLISKLSEALGKGDTFGSVDRRGNLSGQGGSEHDRNAGRYDGVEIKVSGFNREKATPL